MAKLYRKKPVEVEVVQFTGFNRAELAMWAGGVIMRGETIAIETLEGVMIANPGDYIIKGVKGEFYPCRQDIFEETYDEV